MQEVHVLPIDGGGELRNLVKPGLVLTPVVDRAPGLDQLDEVVLAHPVGSADAWEFIGPAGTGQPVDQVVEICLRNIDTKRLGCAHAVHRFICIGQLGSYRDGVVDESTSS